MTTVRDRVLALGRYWRKRLEEPESLVLHDRLISILVALQGELSQKTFNRKDPDSFRTLLVLRLRNALPAPPSAPNAYLFEVLARKYSGDVIDFQAALHSTTLDPAVLGPPLRRLVTALETDTDLLLDAIEAELNTPDSADSQGRLQAASDALQRRLLQFDLSKTLADSLDKAFFGDGFADAMTSGVSVLAADVGRIDTLWGHVRTAAGALTKGNYIAAQQEAALRGRGQLLYPTVQVIAERLKASGDNDVVEVRALGADALVAWASRALHRMLPPAVRMNGDGDRDRSAFGEAIDAMAVTLLAWVREVPAILDPSDDQYFSDLKPALHSAAEQMTRDVIVGDALTAFRASLLDSEMEQIGQAILESASIEASDAETTWPPSDADLRAQVSRRTAARCDVQERLTAALLGRSPDMARQLTAACQVIAQSATVHPWGNTSVDAWTRLAADIGAHADRADRAIQTLVWEHIPGALRAALESLARPLHRTVPYDVVLTVHGVDAQGESWSTGTIRWYSGDRYQLGEQMWERDGDDAGRTLRAWVTIQAGTSESARAQASTTVDAALNAATFFLSFGETATGLRASLKPYVIVGSATDGRVRSWSVREREELYDAGMARDGQFISATRDAGAIGAAPSTLTPLDRSLARAHAWYREGRWETNPVTRFLTYFVALEHIFLAGKRGMKFKLALSVAELATSWSWVRFDEETQVKDLVNDAEGLRSSAAPGTALERALDAGMHATTWRTDIRPLLLSSCVDTLALALAAEASAGEPSATALLAYHQRLKLFIANHAGYDARRVATQDQWRFVVELLAQRRNDIVHEAATIAPDSQMYARQLESVLGTVVKHLQSVRHLAHISTVDDAVAWHKSPWLQ